MEITKNKYNKDFLSFDFRVKCKIENLNTSICCTFSSGLDTLWLEMYKTIDISIDISFQSPSVPPQTQHPLLNVKTTS